MACRCLSLTFDGGGEGTGEGSKVRARETMAGANSYMDLVWLKRSAADWAFEMLNKAGVFVPLMEFYGYDWENSDFLTRRQGSQSLLAPDRDVVGPSVHDLTGSGVPSVPASPQDAGPAAATAKRPIFDPLAGPPDAAQAPMTFFDFVVWDIARAYPCLNLAMNVRGITEDMVVRTEVYVKCLLDAAFELVVDEEKFKNTISVDGFKRLEHGRFVGSDAVSFVMEPMTLAMGGHLLMGSGGYMDGPTSPLIQVALDAHKIHVLDTISAKNMVINYNEHKTSGFFQARRGLNPDHKAVDLGPDDTVFVGVHRPNHFVSMIVKNLGGDTAASMTVADSFSLPSFSCLTHDALRTAFRERKLIGKEHEIDHFGLALPHQDRCDCAFYMLTYLATVLTEAFLLPELWGWFTRLMRCWTFFLVFRGLVDNQAIHKEASQARPDSNAVSEAGAIPASATVLPELGTVGAPVSIDNPGTAAKDATWMKATEQAQKVTEQARQKALSQSQQQMASKAWTTTDRAKPRQLATEGEVPACKTSPMGVRGSDTEQNWRKLYLNDPLGNIQGKSLPYSPEQKPPFEQYKHLWPKTSMVKSPARYYPMVEQNKDKLQSPVPVGLWCVRHRFHAFTKDTSRSQDRYPELAEGCITCVQSAFLWPRLKSHILTYAGNETGLKPDPIHLEVRKCMRLRVDRCGPQKGDMIIQGESEAPSSHTELIGRVKRNIFTKPPVSAATRWGTRFEGQYSLGVSGRVFAAGLIQATGNGTLQALKKAASAPFQEHGFQVDGSLQMSEKLGKHLRTLTSQTTNLYHAIGRFICVLAVRPMLLAFSTHLECPASSVCGVGSYFRRFLHLVTNEMFVGQFNSADCNGAYRNCQLLGRTKLFRGTSYKFDEKTRKKSAADQPHDTVKMAHRSWASLGGSHKTQFLLNPSADVGRVLGPFATEEMRGAVRALLGDLRRIAAMPSDLVCLPTLEERWAARQKARVVPAHDSNWRQVIAFGKDKPVVKPGASHTDRLKTEIAIAGAQYARNMHKAQWAVREVMRDVVSATEKRFDHELYSLFGFLACMIQARWVKVVKVATGEKMEILIAHQDAIPNGQVGSRILDELQAQFIDQGEQQFLDYYPPQLTDMLTDEAAMRQFPDFLRGDAMEGFHLLDADGEVLLMDTRKKDTDGNPIMIPVVAGPAPLWRFPDLARRVLKLLFRQMSSNDVERVFSLVARGFRGGGKNVGFMCISSWCRRRDWVSGRFFGMEVDPEFLKVYGAARRLMRENEKGFQKVFSVDINTSEQRKRFRQQKDLPAYIKNGGKFAKTNIVPSAQEFLVGPKNESTKDPTARAANSAKTNLIAKRQMAARLSIKQQRAKPAAKTTVGRTGKRRLQGNAQQNQKRSKQCPAAPAADADAASVGGDVDYPDLSPDPEVAGAAADHAVLTHVQADIARSGNASALADDTTADGSDASGAPASATALVSTASAAAAVPDPAAGGADSGAASASSGHAAGGTDAAGPGAAADDGERQSLGRTKRGRSSISCTGGAAAPPEPNSHSDVLAKQIQMNELEQNEAPWHPSVRVQVPRSKNDRRAFGMRRPDGEVHVVRSESSCILNLAYHEADGAVKLIQIVKTLSEQNSLYMEYYFVYPSTEAIREAALKEDEVVSTTDASTGATKSFTRVGANALESIAQSYAGSGVVIHHAGDILHNSNDQDEMNLGNIVGTIAWRTRETLVHGQSKISKEDTKKLKLDLKILGIPDLEAGRLAQNPIFVGCIFNEKIHAIQNRLSEDEESEEESNCSNKESFQLKQATGQQARDQRAKERAKRCRQESGDGGPGK